MISLRRAGPVVLYLVSLVKATMPILGPDNCSVISSNSDTAYNSLAGCNDFGV